jgi:hypothetical protein
VTSPALPLLPSDEIVTVAWIATIGGFTPAMVGTTLPADVDPDGGPAGWLQTGYVTVATVGGTPDDLLPVNRPVMEVKCWAAVPGSNKPPWMMARALASAIQQACWDRYQIARPLTPTVNGVAYPAAVVQSAWMAQSFRRLYADAADYAVYQADMALQWVTVGQLLH